MTANEISELALNRTSNDAVLSLVIAKLASMDISTSLLDLIKRYKDVIVDYANAKVRLHRIKKNVADHNQFFNTTTAQYSNLEFYYRKVNEYWLLKEKLKTAIYHELSSEFYTFDRFHRKIREIQQDAEHQRIRSSNTVASCGSSSVR